MKSSTLLREAQKHILACQSWHLCYALHYAANVAGTVGARKKGFLLQSRIMKSIQPYATADAWLHEKIKARGSYEVWCEKHKWTLRGWRIRWLDALIAEYEEKGD